MAVDVAYEATRALSAGVTFTGWDDATPTGEFTTWVSPVVPYVPGEFFRRELPCILALLPLLPASPELIIVDGYVQLGAEQRAGLGQHLYEALDGTIPIIGVAKKAFQGTPATTELYRGGSTRPLYVTAVGIDGETAKGRIAAMHGNHRLPTLLKRVDQLCRGR
ncbi:MAG: endonuclease V [Caldilineaceae bacterium]|nr:endonuclease V [Caldilineaceae bacterium]